MNSTERSKIRIFPFLAKLPVDDERWLVGFVRAAVDPSSEAEKARKFGARASAFEVAESPSSAEVCVLPYVWDYYVRNRKVKEATKLAEAAKKSGKDIIVWNGGDLEGIVPILNAMQFNHGPSRSLPRAPRKVFAFPQFKPDWLHTYCSGNVKLRPWKPVPIVGFCGLAARNGLRLLARTGLTAWHICQYHLGRSAYVPPPLRSVILLRGDVLRLLSNDKRIESNFVIREEYRGGLKAGLIWRDF